MWYSGNGAFTGRKQIAIEGERPQFASVTVTVFWRFGELTVAYTVRAVHGLDFSVSPAKSEAIWFYDKRWRGTFPPGLCINIAGEAIEMGSQMKYLGLIIDSQWPFGPCFELLASKVLCQCFMRHATENWRGWSAMRQLYEGVSNLGSCMEPVITFVCQRDISVSKQLSDIL